MVTYFVHIHYSTVVPLNIYIFVWNYFVFVWFYKFRFI